MAVAFGKAYGETTTDARWRSAMQAISATIKATGITQTADTGQVDLASVAAPAAGASAGFEMFKLPDAASYPIYLKVEYGRHDADNPAIWITMGEATNGSGTLSGDGSTNRRKNHTVSLGSASTTLEEWAVICAAGDNYFYLFWGNLTVGGSRFHCMTGVERIRDGDGTIYAGKLWYSHSGSNTQEVHYYSADGTLSGNPNGAVPQPLPSNSSSYPASDFIPWRLAVGGDDARTILMLWYNNRVFVAGETFEADYCGETHEYLALGPFAYNTSTSEQGYWWCPAIPIG